ncbi:MAG: DUF5591 domain-containing protein [Desulfurococcales archaeon]|nr:DUF5591 domain-containing protein [Desulfurococcales archaeon]
MKRKSRYTVSRTDKGWPAKGKIYPDLSGFNAWKHKDVVAWRSWVSNEYLLESDILLLTPCSNVKPYPKSPTSRKIRGVLRRLGYWDDEGNGLFGAPIGVEWSYLSDLLVLVPYIRAHEYPACCYEYAPQIIGGEKDTVIEEIRETLLMFFKRNYKLRIIILYLPRFYNILLEPVLNNILDSTKIFKVKYHIFYGHRWLENVLREVL